MIVYGRNPVREALRGRREVRTVWATERAAREPWLRDVGRSTPPLLRRSTERSGSPEHQGICAEVSPYPYADADALLRPDDALVVCLDEVQDPHNLGAVCRVAEAAGCAGVVICERRAAEVTPAVCKASAGAVEHLPIARVRNLADWLARPSRLGAWVYGAAADARVPYDRPDYTAGWCWCSARGQGPAATGGGRLRRAGRAASPRPRRLAERLDRGGGAGVRDLAFSTHP